MKLTNPTIAVLKNFASINSNFWYAGDTPNTIASISNAGNILVYASIEETLDREFCIYDLSDFLSVLSIGDEPEIEFKEKNFEISWKSSKISYLYADKSIFDVENSSFKHLKKGITMPECEISFLLDADTITSVRKASSILKAQNLSISSGDNGNVVLKTYDKTNPNSNLFEVVLPETSTEHEFNMVLSIDNLKIVSGDYNVKISSKNIAHFEKSTGDIQYYIAMDSTSSFG